MTHRVLIEVRNGGAVLECWYDLGEFGSAEELQERIAGDFRLDGGEKVSVAGSEGFAGILPNRKTALARIFATHEAMAKHDRKEAPDAFRFYLRRRKFSIEKDDAAKFEAGFEKAFQGEYESREAFAVEKVRELGIFDNVSSEFNKYFNYNAYAADLFGREGYSWAQTGRGTIFVFRDGE